MCCRKMESKHIVFSNEIQKQRSYKELWDMMKKNADLRADFLRQSTSFQVTVLKVKDDTKNRYIMVGNTHLYYHPDANHIRLIQVKMATAYLTYLKKKYERVSRNNKRTPYKLYSYNIKVC